MGAYQSFLLVEWPLPWPHDLSEIPALASLGADLAAAGCRLQGIVPPGDQTQRRVVRYHLDSTAPFAGYRRSELIVDPADVISAARQLLADPPLASSDGRPTDVLVCTHGRRDRCCGSFGTELALQLLADPDCLGSSTRVSRTSHTGGHRFAPTAMVFPEGTGWAFADMDLLSKVVQRRGPITDVLDRYRGCAGLDTPEAQVVERGVLAEIGWDLFDLPRWSTRQADGAVRLHVQYTDRTDVWEGRVAPGRVLPVPECGAPVGAARKTSTEYRLTSLQRL